MVEADSIETTLDSFSEFVLEVWKLTRDGEPGRFEDAALAVVRQRIPFDGALWGYATVERTVLQIHAVHLVEAPEEAMADYELVKHLDPVVREVVAHPGQAVLYDGSAPPAGADPRWLDFNERYRMQSILQVMRLQKFSRLAMFVSLHRNAASPPFDERERVLLQALVPQLESAYETARLRGVERDAQRSEGGALAAIAYGLGRLHLAEAGFEDFIRAEWPAWRGPSLPDELAGMSANGGDYKGSRLVVSAATPTNGFATLWARPPIVSDQLSARESEIARLWVEGKGSKEIAAELSLSPNTVRNRVQNIYWKLGVHDRVELERALHPGRSG